MTRRKLVRGRVPLLALVLGLLLAGCGNPERNLNEERAVRRVQDFAQAVNYEYQTPEKIYPYLTEEFRSQMSVEEFCEAFVKERSYPYLTPLFINYESIDMAADLQSGTAYFSQAARLPGMVYELPVVFEQGDYYVAAFEDFPDGSYLEKFEGLSYSLESYFD